MAENGLLKPVKVIYLCPKRSPRGQMHMAGNDGLGWTIAQGNHGRRCRSFGGRRRTAAKPSRQKKGKYRERSALDTLKDRGAKLYAEKIRDIEVYSLRASQRKVSLLALVADFSSGAFEGVVEGWCAQHVCAYCGSHPSK